MYVCGVVWFRCDVTGVSKRGSGRCRGLATDRQTHVCLTHADAFIAYDCTYRWAASVWNDGGGHMVFNYETGNWTEPIVRDLLGNSTATAPHRWVASSKGKQ